MHSYEIQTTFLSLLHALPSPLLTSSSLLSFSLFLHFDIFIFKKKTNPKFTLTLCLSSLCSLFSLLASSFLLSHSLFSSSSHPISFTSLLQFCLSSPTPSSCLTHNHSRLISITQHLSLLLFSCLSLSCSAV